MCKRCEQFTVADQKEIGGIGLRKKAPVIEHDGIVHPGHIGLDLSEDVVEQVVVVDVAVQKLGAVATDRTGHQSYPFIAIDHAFEFGHHNEP